MGRGQHLERLNVERWYFGISKFRTLDFSNSIRYSVFLNLLFIFTFV